MPQADLSTSTPARKPQRGLTTRQMRRRLETALEQLLAAAEAIVADLDEIDGDPDLEPSLGSLGATYHTGSDQRLTHHGVTDDREHDAGDDREEVCEGEGDYDEREPDQDHMCNWQDEGDQTKLRQLPVYSKRRKVKSPHQNVGEFVAVRVL